MSTKAYDYFITDLSVFDAADRIRETIIPVFLDRFRQQQERLSERLQYNVNLTWEDADLDEFPVNLPSDSQRILPANVNDYSQLSTWESVQALYGRMTELKNSTRRTLSPVDIFYDVQIMRGPEDNTIVFKVFSECRDYTKALETQDWCRDFSYWNNTDKDDDVTEKEWERRKQYWDAMPYTPPSESAVGFTQPCEYAIILASSD